MQIIRLVLKKNQKLSNKREYNTHNKRRGTKHVNITKKNSYYKGLVDNNIGSAKNQWRTIKEITGSRKNY